MITCRTYPNELTAKDAEGKCILCEGDCGKQNEAPVYMPQVGCDTTAKASLIVLDFNGEKEAVL